MMSDDTQPPVSQELLEEMFEKKEKEILEKAKLVEQAFKNEHERHIKNNEPC